MQADSSVGGSYSFPLLFDTLPEVNQGGSQWTKCEIADAINLVNKNIQKLDSYLSIIVRILHHPFICVLTLYGHLVIDRLSSPFQFKILS